MSTQSQSQNLQQKAVAYHAAMMNIFQANILEIEQLIQDELNDNPLIEYQEENPLTEDDESGISEDNFEANDDNENEYRMEYAHYLSREDFPQTQLEEDVDFRTELKKQFRLMNRNGRDYERADFIIDSLNDKGFLEQGLESMAEEISFKEKKWVPPEDLESIIRNIQFLEPKGCATLGMKEYMLFQLRTMNRENPNVKMAIDILESHFEDLKKNNLKKIRKDLGLAREVLSILLETLAGLNKSPCVVPTSTWAVNDSIIPDFLITIEDDNMLIQLSREYSSRLCVNQTNYSINNEKKNDSTGKHALEYLKNKLASAKWFINAIRERESNMLKIMKAIAGYQREYLLTHDEMLLKPMGLKDISKIVLLDVSTISRITSNKYAETPLGLIRLKNLFIKKIQVNDGGFMSNKVLRETVRDIIDSEDKKNPFTDKEIVKLLVSQGIKVARRTITKYREEMHIYSAGKRSQLK